MRWRGRLVIAGAFAAAVTVGANAVVVIGGRSRPASNGGVALVLGAGLRADGSPSLMLADRLETAARLYREGSVSKVLASGDHGTHPYDEVRAMRTRLVDLGVPDELVFTDHAGFDTWSSVVRAKKVFGATRVTIVTQRFHLARAVWLARRAGLDADGVAADIHPYGSKGKEASAREVVARVKAAGEVLFRRQPRFLGPRIDLDGDGRSTAD
jgi:SanA protein